jgi:hypothetical protein
MGAKLGTIFARAGHDVVFSYSRSERKLKRLAREARGHARAGTPREAALNGDVLLLAVHWSRVGAVLKQAGDLSGKVIVTCSLPMNANDNRVGCRPYVVGGRNAGQEGTQGSRRLRVQHSPERSIVRRLQAQEENPSSAEPLVLRRGPQCEEDRDAADSRCRFRTRERWTATGRPGIWSPSPSRSHNLRTKAMKDLRSPTESSVSGRLRNSHMPARSSRPLNPII